MLAASRNGTRRRSIFWRVCALANVSSQSEMGWPVNERVRSWARDNVAQQTLNSTLKSASQGRSRLLTWLGTNETDNSLRVCFTRLAGIRYESGLERESSILQTRHRWSSLRYPTSSSLPMQPRLCNRTPK